MQKSGKRNNDKGSAMQKCLSLFPSHTVSRICSLLLLCLILPLLTSCESKRTIAHDLEERDANEILVYLDNKGVKASKQKQGEVSGGGAKKLVLYDIVVSTEDETRAYALLNYAGLPRRAGRGLLDIFGESGLVPTEIHETVKYQRGLGEDIAQTIRKIDGILDAEVNISFPKEDVLNPNAVKEDIKASVYVKHSGVLDDPNSHLATKIKRIVAGAVPGLKYDNVNLIPDRARFSDIPIGNMNTRSEDEKQLVNIWSLTLAKESVSLFRIIFFSFIIVVLAAVLLVVWIGWKVHPLLHNHGGLKGLFSLKPISTEKTEPTEIKEETESGEPKEMTNADVNADFEGDLDVDVKK